MNKKGFQLSINMLVVIILSIVLFGAGMILFNKVISEGTNIESKLTGQMTEQLETAMDDGSLIVMPKQRITAQKGDSAKFSFGFWNEFEESDFEVNIISNNETMFPNKNIIYTKTYKNISTNERVYGLIAIIVSKNTTLGQYSFDLEINRKINSNKKLYTGHKNRFYIIVP